MAVADVANGLVGLCSQGQLMEAIEKYYSDDIVSVEPVGGPGMPAVQNGIEAAKAKNQWWAENHEVHGLSIKGPYVGDGAFAVLFEMDVTPKMTRKRGTMREMAVYQVEGEKITHEEFFYNAPGS